MGKPHHNTEKLNAMLFSNKKEKLEQLYFNLNVIQKRIKKLEIKHLIDFNTTHFYMKGLLVVVVFLHLFGARASHIVGGDIYYDYLGGNQYRIYISVFRDCLSNGAGFDSPLPLGIFFNSDNSLFQSLDVPYTGSNNVPVTFNNPCVIPPTNICTENSVYTIVVTLPPTPQGYRISYVRCCRGPKHQ